MLYICGLWWLLPLIKCSESFHTKDQTRRKKQKNLQQDTTESQNTEKHTEKAETYFIGPLVYVGITSEMVWIHHTCSRFLKLTRRDKGEKKEWGQELIFYPLIFLSKQQQFNYAAYFFGSGEMKRQVNRPVNLYSQNIFQLHVVSDPLWPHSHCKNLFNYLPLLQ